MSAADARSPAERRLAEARADAHAWSHEIPDDEHEVFHAHVERLIAAAREAERDRLLAGQYDADVDPGAAR